MEETVTQRRATVVAPRSPSPSRASAPAFPLVGFVKLIIFGFIAWWVATTLLAIPEIRALKDSAMRGDAPSLESAIETVRTAVTSAVQRALASPSDPPQPPNPMPPRTTPGPGESPVEREPVNQPARDTPPPPADTQNSLEPANLVEPPRVQYRVLPSYTPEGRRQGIQGAVRLKAIVQPNGQVSDVAIVRSLDRVYGLDQQAVSALRQWRFAPLKQTGRPGPIEVEIELTFKLR